MNDVKTLRTQDTPDPRHLTGAEMSRRHFITSTELPRPPANIFCYNCPYIRKVYHI